MSNCESFGCMESQRADLFGFEVLSDGLKTDSGSGGSGSHIYSLTEEESEKTRSGGEKKQRKTT